MPETFFNTKQQRLYSGLPLDISWISALLAPLSGSAQPACGRNLISARCIVSLIVSVELLARGVFRRLTWTFWPAVCQPLHLWDLKTGSQDTKCALHVLWFGAIEEFNLAHQWMKPKALCLPTKLPCTTTTSVITVICLNPIIALPESRQHDLCSASNS